MPNRRVEPNFVQEERVNIRISEALRNRLRAIAKMQGRRVPAVMRDALYLIADAVEATEFAPREEQQHLDEETQLELLDCL